MARIQVLELPTLVEGDRVTTPFALVIDQVGADVITAHGRGEPIRTALDITHEQAQQMAKQLGAVGAIVTAQTLEIA